MGSILVLFNFIICFFLFAAITLSPAQRLYTLPQPSLPNTNHALSTDSANTEKGLFGDTVSWSSGLFYYQAAEKKFSLYNKAVLNHKDYQLLADTILLYNSEEMVEAFGHPVIKDNNNPDINGYRLKYNHRKKIGEMYYGSSTRDNQTFNGMEVRRQPTGQVYITRGDFTSCDPASYFFYSRRLVLEPNKRVLARPIVMNLGEVTVAVAPMFVMPLGKGRRSGLLRPKMGGDQLQGFFIRDLGYYLVTNDYTDLLISGDMIEGEKGTFDKTNLRSQFRYNKRYFLTGNIGANSYVSDFNPGNSGWEVNFTHDQNLTPDAVQKLTGRGRFVSSSKVLDEALDESEAINQTANANLGYSNMLEWNRARVNVNAMQNYNLTTGHLERELPSASMAFQAPLFPAKESVSWDPVDAADEVSWFRKLNYSYSGSFNTYTKENGSATTATATKLDSLTFVGAKNHLDLSGKYAWFQYINVTPQINFEHFWSLHSNMEDGPEPAVDLSSGDFGDNLYKWNMGVSTNTKLYGIAEPNLGRWEKIRHVITPSVGFTYVPQIDSNKSFVPHPRLSAPIAQDKAKNLNLSLNNQVDIKISPNDTSKLTKQSITKKIFNTSTSSSYNFESKDRKWSDISTTISTEIVKYIPLNVSFVHKVYDDYAQDKNNLVFPILYSYSTGWRKSLSFEGQLNAGTRKNTSEKSNNSKTASLATDRPPNAGNSKVDNWHNRPGSASMSLYETKAWSASADYSFNYRETRVSTTAFKKDLVHAFNASVKLNPTPMWEMSYNTAFDFEKGQFSKHSFTFNRLLRCWKMDFSWTPVGIGQGWFFKIYIIDLPDIKLESSQTNIKRQGR